MNLFKRSCLMAGGAAFFYENQDFRAGRFWPWVFDLAVIAALLYLSKPSKEAKAADEQAHEATATIERFRVLVDKMRHGEDPFGGSAADSADTLDAALDTPTKETPDGR